MSFSSPLEVTPGDRLRVLALATPPAAPGWRPTLRPARGTLHLTPGPWGPRRACALLRRAFERALLDLVPGPRGAMLATLVLGRATRPDFALTDAHRATGLSHLLAVSGAHAAMLAYLLGLTNRGRRLGAGRARLSVIVTVLCVYGCVAGAEPPVVRAVVAFLLSVVASRTGRSFGLAAGLLAPALVTAAVTPAALTSVSFLLSYAAVLGLGVAAGGRSPDDAPGWWSTALRASFWATMLTTPLTLWFFGQVAPTTILLTPLCAPIVALMLLLGLVAASLAALAPALAGWLAAPLQLFASIYAGIVHTADMLPGTPVPARNVPPGWLITIVCAAAAAWVWVWPRRRTLAWGVTLLSSLWFVPIAPAMQSALQVFAVGHGQAALLTTASGAQALVDCGSLHGGGSAARAVAAALRRRRLDLVVITHDDTDHHNGLALLLDRVVVNDAVLPASMQGSGVHDLLLDHACRVALLRAGQRLRFGELSVHAPGVPDGASDNDRSLWVRARIRDAAVLLTGDAQELGVAAALAGGIADEADVLLLPHHGRSNRNLPHLLAAVRPRACLASSAGADGETALGAIARRFGAEVWTTGRHGDLTFDGRTVQPAHVPALLGRASGAR